MLHAQVGSFPFARSTRASALPCTARAKTTRLSSGGALDSSHRLSRSPERDSLARDVDRLTRLLLERQTPVKPPDPFHTPPRSGQAGKPVSHSARERAARASTSAHADETQRALSVLHQQVEHTEMQLGAERDRAAEAQRVRHPPPERKLDHCLTLWMSDEFNIGLLGSWFGPEVALHWLFPYPLITLRLDVMMLPSSARAEVTALPKVDTNCITPSLIPR
jgi:hypothetical protein